MKEKKETRTTVVLTDSAQEVKERLTVEWELRKLLSAALLLFDRQDPIIQKAMVLQASGVELSPDLADALAAVQDEIDALHDSRAKRRTPGRRAAAKGG